MIQILLAFIAGILTVAAPCILLPLPIVLGGSVGQSSRTRPIFIVLGFVLSFSLLALLLNYLVAAFGINPNTLRTGAAILLAIFALLMIWPAPFEIFMSKFNGLIGLASRTGNAAGSGNLGGFVLGAVIGIIWAPCAGPILASILTLIALQQNLFSSLILLVVYAVGAGLPMLLIAYGGQALTTRIKSLAHYSQRLQQIFGVILIFMAIAIYFRYDTYIESKLSAAWPNFSANLEQSLFHVTNVDKINVTAAPEFAGISHWLNSDPLTLKDLRGKVVLIDFWTYSCINCVRTLPYLTSWYEKYKDQGLVIVGVHSPEFAFEKDTANVQLAISQYKIAYPVAQDNDFQTWHAYSNNYWPAEYLIDQKGQIVHTHFGEGEYDQTENAIRQLLGLKPVNGAGSGPDMSGIATPEMYFGTDRQQYLAAAQSPAATPTDYNVPTDLSLNEFALGGSWQFEGDRASLIKGSGKIKLHFSSAKVFMVAQSLNKPVTLKITVDGQAQPDVVVGPSNLYTLFDSNKYQDHVLEITIPDSGFEAFTFTFG